MDKNSSNQLFKILPAVYIVIALVYVIIIIQPSLYFHHTQPPFLLSKDFFSNYLKYPGGLSELIANFIMQFFYLKISGSIILMSVAILIMISARALLNVIYKSRFNIIWALAIMSFALILTSNYKFPFSIIISAEAVLLVLLFLVKFGMKPIYFVLIYSLSASFLYYFSGSGYMFIFSASALVLTTKFHFRKSLITAAFIITFSYLTPQFAWNFIFPIPPNQKYFYLFAPKLDFMAYTESAIFYVFLLSIIILVIWGRLACTFQNKFKLNDVSEKQLSILAFLLLFSASFYSHNYSYQSDAKKMVASDYYCYTNNVEKTTQAARNMKNYNFMANMNYNIAINRAGKLTEDFFKFFQISGTDAVHPDNQFFSEVSFISADFYYDLGYISEARHWAYESLVFYPFSIRTLQILVKIHLITGEYKAAEEYLNILKQGVLDRDFVKKYLPYVKDTSLISSNREILEKRSSSPAEHELNPFIEERFKELLGVNPKNKTAYEYLMLYYLLDAQLANFLELYEKVGDYFSKPVAIYEEALLMYGAVFQVSITEYDIRPETRARFDDFIQKINQFKGDQRGARNFLYKEYGQSYMYYLQFLYPRILKPEIIKKDDW
ncbi:MAG: DUF6057 family protein [Bacteroidales bacterium]|nr:DUF6057 family protein [Bacteroidales bacterium]MCF8389854.1 DUF6057 family protein [Bacteroidales bacterium]